MPRVSMIQFAQLNSVRVKQKVIAELRPGLTLLDLALRKMKIIGNKYNLTPLLAVAPQDEIIIQKAKEAGIETLTRSQNTGTYSWDREVQGLQEQLESRFDQVVDVNLICRPFVRPETIGIMCETAQANPPTTCVAVEAHRGILWDGEETLISGQGMLADTKNNPPYYRLAHLGYTYPVANFSSEKKLTAKQRLIPIEYTAAEERLDVDTPSDLELVQKLWPLLEKQYV